jgi:signal transduction histidine kinase
MTRSEPLTLAQDLIQMQNQLRELSAQLLDTREDERRRVARGLHDELGQLLTALKIDLTSLAASSSDAGQTTRIQAMMRLVDATFEAVRRISDDLRPLILDDLGLNVALESLARKAAQHMGIEVTVRREDTDPPISTRVATALYRSAQEALTNVARHAQATDACIDLRMQDGEVVLRVVDNGIGLPADALQRKGSWGLKGMQERALLMQGAFSAENAPGGGTCISLRVPLLPGPL